MWPLRPAVPYIRGYYNRSLLYDLRWERNSSTFLRRKVKNNAMNDFYRRFTFKIKKFLFFLSSSSHMFFSYMTRLYKRFAIIVSFRTMEKIEAFL